MIDPDRSTERVDPKPTSAGGAKQDEASRFEPDETNAGLEAQLRRVEAARDYVAALEAERNHIWRALEILTETKPCYGDVALAGDLGVEPRQVARIRAAAGLEWECHRRYSSETREHVIDRLRRNNGNVKRTTRETGIPESTVRAWKSRYLTNASHEVTT